MPHKIPLALFALVSAGISTLLFKIDFMQELIANLIIGGLIYILFKK